MRALKACGLVPVLTPGRKRNKLDGVTRRAGRNQQRQFIDDAGRHTFLLRTGVRIELGGVSGDFDLGGGIAYIYTSVNARRLIGTQLDFALDITLEARRLNTKIVGAGVQVGKGVAAAAVGLDRRAKLPLGGFDGDRSARHESAGWVRYLASQAGVLTLSKSRNCE